MAENIRATATTMTTLQRLATTTATTMTGGHGGDNMERDNSEQHGDNNGDERRR